MTGAIADKTAGQWLRGERQRIGLRPVDLAAALEVDRRLLYLWETDRRPMPGPQVERARKVLEELDPAGELLAAVQRAGAEGLPASEVHDASPRLAPAMLDDLTAASGPLRWIDLPRVDARGRRYLRRYLTDAGSPDAHAHAAPPAITGAQLAGVRLLLGLPREALARRLQISVTTLSQWERGTRDIPPGRQPELLTLAQDVTGAGVRAARTAAGLGLNELAHAAGMPQSDVSRWERQQRRAPGLPTLLRIAETIATLPPPPAPGETAWAALLEVLRDAGTDGVDHTRLMNAAKQGRRADRVRVPPSARETELARRVRSGNVERFGHLVPTRGGGQRVITRYRLAGLVKPVAPMSVDELHRRLEANDVTAAALARMLGVSSSATWRWCRGLGPCSGFWAASIRALLPRQDVAPPERRVRARVLAACRSHPGNREQIVRAAGYGKGNRRAEIALAQLVATGEVHRVYVTRAGGRRVSYQTAAAGTPVTGAQVRAARRRLELSQAQFGARFGVSAPTVSLWESAGDRPIPAGRWAELRRAVTL